MSNASIIEQLAEALAPAIDAQRARRYGVTFKHDPASSNPSGLQYSHGPHGSLTFPGVEPAVFSTMVGGSSLLAQIPTSASLYTNPTYYTITGVQDDVGSEKDGVCDDAPYAGLMKGCLTTSVFGRYERATPTVELNRLGLRNDRADPIDLRLMNSPVTIGGPFMAGPAGAATPADLLTNEVSRKFWERAVSFQRILSRQIWSGNPTNNSAGGGYKEMTGLDMLIATGYADAETNQRCISMDSDVKNFNYLNINTAANATALVTVLASMYHFLKDRAQRSGIMPVRWVMAMRPELFYEITSIWPCSYMTFGCLLTANGTNMNNVDASDMIRMRDEMRAGSYLLIDGDRIDVVLDDGIAEDSNTTNANVPNPCFASNIYFIPMSVAGGFASTFLEYVQYNNPSVQAALANGAMPIIEGPWVTWIRERNLCIEWQSKIEPRMVLRTPWLAGRVDHVVYCPLQHTLDTFPDDPYFRDGGRTSRPGPSYYTLWGSTGTGSAAVR